MSPPTPAPSNRRGFACLTTLTIMVRLLATEIVVATNHQA